MKEYVIYDAKGMKVYRISRKMRKKDGMWRNKITNLTVSKGDRNTFTIQNCENNNNSPKYKTTLSQTFVVLKDRIIPTHKKKYVYGAMPTEWYTKYVQRKINRILKKEFGLPFKIGRNTLENILRFSSPAISGLIDAGAMPNSLVPMLPVYAGQANVKKAIKKYCGFSGKKFLADLFGCDPHTQSVKLKTIRLLRKHLTFGEIDIKKVNASPMQNEKTFRKLYDSNPSLIKKTVLHQSNFDFWMLQDIIYLYDRICEKLDLESLESTELCFAKRKDISKYHDVLAVADTKLAEPNLKFDEHPIFNGVTLGGFEVEVARDSYTLIEWSQYMHNCVSGYARRCKNREIIILALKKQEIIYNLSLTYSFYRGKATIEQLNGRYNRGYLESDKENIERDLDVLSRQAKEGSDGFLKESSRIRKEREIPALN